MAIHRFIHYVVGSKTVLPQVYLHCHIKPRASKPREGVTALTEDAVHIRVAAIPRGGESNRAVLDILSQALNVHKSDLEIIRGAKSRDKTIAIGGRAVQDGEACVSRLLKRLVEAAKGGEE